MGAQIMFLFIFYQDFHKHLIEDAISFTSSHIYDSHIYKIEIGKFYPRLFDHVRTGRTKYFSPSWANHKWSDRQLETRNEPSSLHGKLGWIWTFELVGPDLCFFNSSKTYNCLESHRKIANRLKNILKWLFS